MSSKKNNRIRVKVKSKPQSRAKTQTLTIYHCSEVQQRAILVPVELEELFNRVPPTIAVLDGKSWRINGKTTSSVALFNATLAYPIVTGERKSNGPVKSLPDIARPITIDGRQFSLGQSLVIAADTFVVHKGKAYVIGERTKPKQKGKKK